MTHGIPWFLGILAFDTKIQAAVEDGCVQESKIHRTFIACDVQGINMGGMRPGPSPVRLSFILIVHS